MVPGSIGGASASDLAWVVITVACAIICTHTEVPDTCVRNVL